MSSEQDGNDWPIRQAMVILLSFLIVVGEVTGLESVSSHPGFLSLSPFRLNLLYLFRMRDFPPEEGEGEGEESQNQPKSDSRTGEGQIMDLG